VNAENSVNRMVSDETETHRTRVIAGKFLPREKNAITREEAPGRTEEPRECKQDTLSITRKGEENVPRLKGTTKLRATLN